MSGTKKRLSWLICALVVAFAAAFALFATPARADDPKDKSAVAFFEWIKENSENGSAEFNDAQAALDILTASDYLTPDLDPKMSEVTHPGSAEDATYYENIGRALSLLWEINTYRQTQGKSELKVSCYALACAMNQCNWFSVKTEPSNAYTGTDGAEVVAYEEQDPISVWKTRPTDNNNLTDSNFAVAGAALHFDGTNWKFNEADMIKGASWDVYLETAGSSQKTYTVLEMINLLRDFVASMNLCEWETNDGCYYLRLWGNTYANDELITIDGKTYGFAGDSSNYRETVASIGDKQYYFDKDGVMQKNVWIKEKIGSKTLYHFAGADGAFLTSTWKGDYYIDKDGNVAVNCWIKYNKKYYYLGSDGLAVKNTWKQASGKWYYLGSDGAVVTDGWAPYNGSYYYMKSDGTVLKNGWASYNGKWYYMGSDGKALKSSWIYYNKTYYYLGSDGAALTSSWVNYKGTWYYLNADGSVATSTWVNYKGTWYFLQANGTVYTNGWIRVGDDWYYMGSDGKIVTDKWQDGYYLGEDGKARASK